MGKKTKKPVGLIGDFSDDEELETVEEVPTAKGSKKPAKGADSDDEEVNGKHSKKESTNGKQKTKAATKGKSNSDDAASSEDEVQKAPTKGGKVGTDKSQNKKSANGKNNKTVDEDEEEEESKPKKKSTTEAPKKAKKKKGGNWIEYEEEDEDEQSTSKKTSKADESKGKSAPKKQETKKQQKDDEESEESDDEPKKGKAKGGKSIKQDIKKSKQQSDDEESEESDEEPKKGGKAKSGKAKQDNKKSKQQQPDEDEESEESDDEPKKGSAKGGKGKHEKPKQQPDEEEEEKKVTKEAPKKKGKKKGGDDYWNEEYEKDAAAAAGGAQPDEVLDASLPVISGKKKKKNKPQKDESSSSPTPVPAQSVQEVKKESKDTKKEHATAKGGKSDPKQAKGPKGMSKALEMLRKQKEEKERIEREAEEQRKKEEEEERLRLEEERRIEAEKQRAKEAKKKAAKERKKDQPPEQKQKAGDSLFLQQLREKGLLPKEAVPGAAGGKIKSMVYQTKKKQPKKTDQGQESSGVSADTNISPVEPAATTVQQPEAAPEKEKEKEKEEEAAVDDWENWEEHVDEVAKKLSETNIEAEKPTKPEEEKPAATAATIQPTQTTATSVQQKPKAEENGKAKSGGGGKKDKKAAKKGGGKTDDKPDASTEEANPETGEKELRSPICCILGHVDTGKTSLLDKIRQTDVQGSEAGGITQQIGATYFPMPAIEDKTKALSDKFKLQIKVPGLLVIDTPGHESFTNLRSRGSGLCDIAILVVDIMHALEPQTIESINLLRMRKTPFVVALNKVDRIYGWRSKPFNPFKDSLKIQDKSAVLEFETRTKETISAFAEHGLNAMLYYKNTDFRKYVSLVPTSAHTGEGIPDLLMLLVQLTQKMMPERLHFTEDVQCTVLEVKVIEGLGTTLDVILVNGMLHEGDTIVLCGMNGPIVTTIRAVLAPQPLRELRVKGSYEKLKEIKAAMGVKIVAQDLEKAIAGSALFVAKSEEDIEDLKEEVQADFDSVLNSVDSSSRGVCVQASTLGSLEALLTFLKASKIPVSGVSIGPIHKRDVIRASVMLEHQPEFAVILAFDVKVEKDAQALADSSGVQIFTADIIYHLFDRFTAYMAGLKQKKREAAGDQVVWPCIVRIKPDCIFNKKAPLVLGMDIIAGTLRLGTPLCVPNKNFVDIGIVTGIEKNHKQQQEAKKGDEVAVKIESSPENAKEFGKHFDAEHDVCSRISRESIDLLVSLWGEELSQTDRQLIVKLKGVFKIQ